MVITTTSVTTVPAAAPAPAPASSADLLLQPGPVPALVGAPDLGVTGPATGGGLRPAPLATYREPGVVERGRPAAVVARAGVVLGENPSVTGIPAVPSSRQHVPPGTRPLVDLRATAP